ncbi:MAG: TRAM domain-containing protein [Acidobacteriota bacterium]
MVNVEAPKERLGEIVTVEIDEAKVNSLSGRIV